MTENVMNRVGEMVLAKKMSEAERDELLAIGLLNGSGQVIAPQVPAGAPGFGPVEKGAITNLAVLNEAYEYGSAFSRGLRVELAHYSLLFISGTASVDEVGRTVYPGDMRAQCWRTYRNITALLESERASWKDIIKCTCYLRDIERDYDDFNEVRNAFFAWQELYPLPASVGIQARLCRDDLLIEIEAVALLQKLG